MQTKEQGPGIDGVGRVAPPQTQALAFPPNCWPGMTLNWKSPACDVVLHAELPFWLLLPDCDLNVTVGDCMLPVSIAGQATEIQFGKIFRESHRNVALIEKAVGKPSERAEEVLRGATSGVTLRLTRTLMSIKTKVNHDAIVAVQEQGQRHVDATLYLRSFVHGHLPFVNKSINAYRRIAADPFAIEVTEWDLHVWYLDWQDRFIPISLLPYKDNDGFPRAGPVGGEPAPIAFVEPKDLREALEVPELPGEIEILDAWSLHYRGRQSDAIRSLVTSIEVLLEAKLREEFEKKGMTESEVQLRLNESWNNFQARLTEYVQASRRRVPGPITSLIPIINGVRLREELEQVRGLRHKIVHEGERIAYTFRGQMQRVMETMTWLFNWLAEGSHHRKHRIEGHPLRNSMRQALLFDCEYTPLGVVVLPIVPGPDVLWNEELRKQLVASIEKGTADLEKFAFMAVSRIGLKGIDTPAPEPGSSFLHERLLLSDGEGFIPLFLHDTHGPLSADIVERAAARLLSLKIQGQPFSLALLIVNTQNGIEWQHRDVREAVSEAAIQMALQCGIGIVPTVDLLLLVRAAEAKLWSPAEVKQSLMGSGRVGFEPPGYQYAGYVRTFYDRPQVASVDLEESATVRVGDSLVIRLGDRYYQQRIDSMQVKRAAVTEARGSIVGIQTTLSDVGFGDYVFLRSAAVVP